MENYCQLNWCLQTVSKFLFPLHNWVFETFSICKITIKGQRLVFHAWWIPFAFKVLYQESRLFSPDFRTKLQFKYSVLSQPKTISFHLVSLGKMVFLNGKERVMKKYVCIFILFLFENLAHTEDTDAKFQLLSLTVFH